MQQIRSVLHRLAPPKLHLEQQLVMNVLQAENCSLITHYHPSAVDAQNNATYVPAAQHRAQHVLFPN